MRRRPHDASAASSPLLSSHHLISCTERVSLQYFDVDLQRLLCAVAVAVAVSTTCSRPRAARSRTWLPARRARPTPSPVSAPRAPDFPSDFAPASHLLQLHFIPFESIRSHHVPCSQSRCNWNTRARTTSVCAHGVLCFCVSCLRGAAPHLKGIRRRRRVQYALRSASYST